MTEASEQNGNSPIDGTARGQVPDPDRLTELVWARRDNDVAMENSSVSIVRAPRGKASRLQGPRVVNRNTGTRVRMPVCGGPASRSESGDVRTRGRSSRSSRRPGEPATRRRGTCAS